MSDTKTHSRENQSAYLMQETPSIFISDFLTSFQDSRKILHYVYYKVDSVSLFLEIFSNVMWLKGTPT